MKILTKSCFTSIWVVLLWIASGAKNLTHSAGGIRCLECHEVVAPSVCTQWVTCGQDEECYVREFYDRDMQKGYHMGCELKSRCDLYSRLQAVVGKRVITDCFECCNKDDCNTGLCSVGSSTVVNSTNLRCLSCGSVSDPRLCDRWSQCGEDEVCFTRTFIDSDGLEKYKMGCEYKEICSVSNTASGVSSTLPTTCMKCCNTDDCNAGLCKAGVTTTINDTSSSPTASTTPKTPTCPPSFIRNGNSCYLFSNTTSTWTIARTACEKFGARLAVVDTQDEDNSLEFKLDNSTLLSQATGYWIGGFYVTATTEWTWVNFHPIVITNWGPSQPQYSTNDYRLVILNPGKNSGYAGWNWASVSYSTQYNYICETDPV